MRQLRDFFDEERKRIFSPGPFFAARVMARLTGRNIRETGIWEVVPTSARSVFALALLLVVCFLALEFFIPQIPDREMIEAFLEPEQTAAETILYNEDDVPAGQDFLEMIGLEEQ